MKRLMPRVAVTAVLGASMLVAVAVSTAGPATAGCTRHPGDVDNDGYADVMVAQPLRTTFSDDDGPAGAVNFLRGSASGITLQGNQYADVTTIGIPVRSLEDARWGTAKVSGFFHGGCYADYAVGSGSNNTLDDGDIYLFNGGPSGLNTSSVTRYEGDQLHSGTAGAGDTLAVGDYNGDGYDDLAIGFYNSNNFSWTGGVVVMYGSPTGLNYSKRVWLSEQSLGLPVSTYSTGGGDEFGQTIVAGHFHSSAYADLAIDGPGTPVNGHYGAGVVTILNGSANGLNGLGAERFSEDTPSVPGVAEANDGWGEVLSAGDINGDHLDDLIVGAPEETVNGFTDAGAVTILRGTAGGVNATGSQLLDQAQATTPGALTSDSFGHALSTGDYNRDGYADLAIGTPGATVDGAAGAGQIIVMYGSASGITSTGDQIWNQDSTGVLGVAESGDAFGSSLQSANITGTGYSWLVVGVPTESSAGFDHEGVINVFSGSSSGLTATGNQLFDGTTFVNGAVDNGQLGLY